MAAAFNTGTDLVPNFPCELRQQCIEGLIILQSRWAADNSAITFENIIEDSWRGRTDIAPQRLQKSRAGGGGVLSHREAIRQRVLDGKRAPDSHNHRLGAMVDADPIRRHLDMI